jgi:hypothetical protein
MFLTVNLKEQLLPGTFEYMLDELIGGKIDVSVFDTNYRNDETEAPADAEEAGHGRISGTLPPDNY